MSAFMCSIQVTNSARSRGRPRLAHAVDVDAGDVLLGGHALVAAREHVHLDALGDELLGELAHVPREAALDDRRVLPGEDQDAVHGSSRGAVRASGARWRSAGPGEGTASSASPSAARCPAKRSRA